MTLLGVAQFAVLPWNTKSWSPLELNAKFVGLLLLQPVPVMVMPLVQVSTVPALSAVGAVYVRKPSPVLPAVALLKPLSVKLMTVAGAMSFSRTTAKLSVVEALTPMIAISPTASTVGPLPTVST